MIMTAVVVIVDKVKESHLLLRMQDLVAALHSGLILSVGRLVSGPLLRLLSPVLMQNGESIK